MPQTPARSERTRALDEPLLKDPTWSRALVDGTNEFAARVEDCIDAPLRDLEMATANHNVDSLEHLGKVRTQPLGSGQASEPVRHRVAGMSRRIHLLP